jgi:hypothetical protein
MLDPTLFQNYFTNIFREMLINIFLKISQHFFRKKSQTFFHIFLHLLPSGRRRQGRGLTVVGRGSRTGGGGQRWEKVARVQCY